MKRLALVIALVVLATLPFWIGNSYYVNIATQMLIYAILALGLNVLVGYAGLVTLGHAGLFGIAAYAGAVLINDGHGHGVVAIGALLTTLGVTAMFAVLRCAARGLFIAITVALGQIVWHAYRWMGLTNGDTGVSIAARPAPFGLSLARPGILLACFAVFLVTIAAMVIRCRRSAAVRGTRDQPRRMTALGYNVGLTRFAASLFRFLERRRGAAVSLTTISSSARRQWRSAPRPRRC
jgi:branched-chain amino acid transport system permease protein